MTTIIDDAYMLWLSRNKGLTNIKILQLLNRFENAEEIFNLSDLEMIRKYFSNDTAFSNFKKNRNQHRIEELIKEVESSKLNVISINNIEYPKLLKHISDAPICLYYSGNLNINALPCISIVGTRHCSEYGLTAANKISSDLGRCGITIVSGMAEGIDSMAHKGALSVSAYTVAVLGCGADVCYPSHNRNLMEEIIEKGCIISELPPKTTPIPAYFPMRNRIISGLSYATIVVEAAERSGSSITANFAADYGRDVFAVPGSIFSKNSVGTNVLIKDGAYPYTEAKDVLNHLKRQIEFDPELINKENNNKKTLENNETLALEEKIVYDCISLEPITINELVIKTNNTIQVLLFILTKLELRGYIKKQPGQRYIKSI